MFPFQEMLMENGRISRKTRERKLWIPFLGNLPVPVQLSPKSLKRKHIFEGRVKSTN